MINLPTLYFGYLIVLFSIIGFGYLSSKLLSIRLSLGELGLSGILLITILSYITNLFVSHGFIHNSIFLLVGLFASVYSAALRVGRVVRRRLAQDHPDGHGGAEDQ